MKNFIFTIFIMNCFISCSQNKATMNNKEETIRIAYDSLTSINNKFKNGQIYFEAFPDNFKDFNSIFGYSSNNPYKIENEGVLYNDSFKYIDAFFKLNLIDKKKFINKVIDISIDGKWFADGVNYFQHDMKIYLINNLDLFCNILSLRNEKEIESFFIFYFDGLHSQVMPKEFDKIKNDNVNLFEIIKKAYDLKNKNKQ